MKLAEALQERADLQKRIDQLEARIQSSALVQEGETPPEDPLALMEETESCLLHLEALAERINATNCAVTTPEGTLTALLSKRDRLTRQVRLYRNVLETARSTAHRATRTEIKILSAIPVQAYQKKCDQICAELRRGDTLIQSANWTEELLP